jgi:hypothetical protein
LKFTEKFYPDAITCKVEDREKGFYDMAFKRDTQTNVLGFLCMGNETQRYYDLNSEQEIIASLIKELDKMFDGKASATYSGEYILENWGQYEFTQGTWTQALQEKKSHLKPLIYHWIVRFISLVKSMTHINKWVCPARYYLDIMPLTNC